MSPSSKDLVSQIEQGDPVALARAITLVESQKVEHWQQAKELLRQLKNQKKHCYRIGISGPPGVGKSTFIESFGQKLIAQGQKIAVLAIDPSSEVSGGSILGDKTRMEELSRSPLAFVRPSPSRGHLGGVTVTMPAVLMLCEAAQYDWIFVESVGVGQSEVELKHMVDHFTYLAQPGAGDELQGIKKGVLEYVDSIIVNKSDLDLALVTKTKQQYLAALKIMRGKEIPVISVSALSGQGVGDLLSFFATEKKLATFSHRAEQQSFWMGQLLQHQFQRHLDNHPAWKAKIEQLNQQVSREEKMPFDAVDEFFAEIL